MQKWHTMYLEQAVLRTVSLWKTCLWNGLYGMLTENVMKKRTIQSPYRWLSISVREVWDEEEENSIFEKNDFNIYKFVFL